MDVREMSVKQPRKYSAWAKKQIAVGLAMAAIFASGNVCLGDETTDAIMMVEKKFSQRLVVSGGPGSPTCKQGSEWSTEDFVCRPSEAAPTAAQRSLLVTGSGHALGSLVVTSDGFGTGRPVLSVKSGKCPAGVQLEDGTQERVGVKVEFIITPAHEGNSRTITVVLAEPKPAQFLRKDSAQFLVKDSGREVFSLPMLEQALSMVDPVDLGLVSAGDRIEMRLLAFGTMTSCANGQVNREPVSAGVWGPTSTQPLGYLTAAQSTYAWDDSKVAPFKAVVTIWY